MKVLKLIVSFCCLSLSSLGFAVDHAECSDTKTLFAAAHADNRKMLENYLQHRCPIDTKDARGFTLYDVLTLKGDNAMIRRLVAKDLNQKGRYSTRMIRLLQTGLRFLGFDAGIVNGKMTDATRNGIRAYQKSLKQRTNGTIRPDWAAVFYRQLTRRMQSELSALGFDIGRADGIIGKNTRTAMQEFRRQREMPEIDYRYIDDQLIYQLMMAKNDARKQELERRNRRQRSQAKKPPPKKVSKPDQNQQIKRQEKVKTSALPAKKNVTKEKNAQQQEKLKRQLERLVAERKAAMQKTEQQKVITIQKNDPAQLIPDKSATNPDKQSTSQRASPVPARTTETTGKGFKRLSGTLNYQDNSDTLCRLNGQRIDPNWCQTYSRNGNGRQCDAIISHFGTVVSLLCK